MRRLPLLLLLPARGAGSATVDFDAAVRAGDVAAVVGHLDAGRDVEGQSMGSTPLLRAVAQAMEQAPEPDEWRSLAAAAAGEGKDRYAVEAGRQAERVED